MDAVKRLEVGTSFPDICRELGLSSGRFSNGGPSKAVWMYP
jgi:hypothetical protein